MWTKWFRVNDNCEVIEKGAKPIDPLFPRALDPIRRLYEPDYIAPLMDQGTVRSIIKQHCALVDLPYFNPHSFRKTITLAGDEFCKNSKQRKAWSQNLGHEHISTTDQYYGKLDIDEKFSVMDDIRDNSQNKQAIELQALITRLSQGQIDLITNLAKQCVGKGEKE